MKTELAAKCPATTLCYSVARIARPVSDTFQKRRKLETRPVDAQSLLLQKDKKRRKRKGEKKIKKNEKTKDVGHFLESRNFDFLTCPSKQEQRGATEKKDMLSCSSRLELIWPISSLRFWRKAVDVNGLKKPSPSLSILRSSLQPNFFKFVARNLC